MEQKLDQALNEAERLQAALAHAETVVDALRESRDSAVRVALSEGASVSAMSRLIGLTRQSIMRIRDLNEQDLSGDPFEPTLEDVLHWQAEKEVRKR